MSELFVQQIINVIKLYTYVNYLKLTLIKKSSHHDSSSFGCVFMRATLLHNPNYIVHVDDQGNNN